MIFYSSLSFGKKQNSSTSFYESDALECLVRCYTADLSLTWLFTTKTIRYGTNKGHPNTRHAVSTWQVLFGDPNPVIFLLHNLPMLFSFSQRIYVSYHNFMLTSTEISEEEKEIWGKLLLSNQLFNLGNIPMCNSLVVSWLIGVPCSLKMYTSSSTINVLPDYSTHVMF